MLYYGLEWESCDTYMQFKEITAPSTPTANEIRQYAKDSGGVSTMCWKNDAGVEICLPVGGGSIVTGAGVVNRLAYWTSASNLDDVPRTLTAGSVLFVHTDFLPQEDNANFFWDDGNNLLTIGTPGTIHGATGSTRLALDRDDDCVLELTGHGAGKQGSIHLNSSRGSHASQAVVAANDDDGIILARAYDGSVYRNLGAIRFFVDGTPGSNDMPGRISLWTTPDGSSTLAERVRVNSVGDVLIGTTLDVLSIAGRGFRLAKPTSELAVFSYGTVGLTSGFRGVTARGTEGSPSATQADDGIFVGMQGYGASAYASGTKALIGLQASANWSDTNQDTYITFHTTPNASTTRVERMRIVAAGHLILPELSTDPGTAQLAADAAIAIYTKNDTLVFAYNNGGTITYIKLALDGSDITWAHDTTAP